MRRDAHVQTAAFDPSRRFALAMLFWALLASGQINMRTVGDWQMLSAKLINQPVGLAARQDTLMSPKIATQNSNRFSQARAETEMELLGTLE
jgi:hypothetical protein